MIDLTDRQLESGYAATQFMRSVLLYALVWKVVSPLAMVVTVVAIVGGGLIVAYLAEE